MFAVTNVDDIVILALFFGQATDERGAAAGVVVGQYMGIAGILAASIVGALGAGLLPDTMIPYLGLAAAWTQRGLASVARPPCHQRGADCRGYGAGSAGR